MLHIDIICIGKLKEQYLKDACSEYKTRLSRYCSLSIIELSDEKIPDKCSIKMEQDIKEKECDKILSHIKKDSYPIALDLTGKQFSSEEFSQKLENLSITFIIGGSLGLTSLTLQKMKELVCFSKLTFPHQLIRIFLLEQLFRAFKISNHENYHK